MKYGVQLFSLRKYLKDVEGYGKVFAAVRNMGAEVVQLSGGKPIPAEDVKRISESSGLPVCITHDPYDRLKGDLDHIAEEHAVYGCKNLGIGMMPSEFRGSLDGVRKFAEFLSETAEKLSGYGMTMSYHNHWFEFDEVGGKLPYDVLIEETDPRVLFIPDTYWMKVKGADIAGYLGKLRGRVNTLHLKDYKKSLGVPLFRAVGKGDIDFVAVLNAAEAAGVENAVIELDISPNPMKSMAFAMNALKRDIIPKLAF